MNITIASPEQGWLGRMLLAPATTLGDLAETIEHAVSSEAAIVVVLAVAGVLAAARALVRLRRRWLSARARRITVLIPPEVDPRGALDFWSHLIGQLRPTWTRIPLG
ncbi:hypothetical protein [Nocardia beijingensis]|uniref:hypothetical protein n=1 Tax=Nocardia beijingensis TaxID=95162 RepID=UPI00082EB3FA|nr:hypothetical protein [Nocardia beijingensis]